MNISIFDYEDPSIFLFDIWDDKKKKNPRFTIRGWSKQMGIKHHSLIHEMIHGKRPVSKSYAHIISQSLNFDVTQSLYFETIIDLKKAKSESMRQTYLVRLNELKPRPRIEIKELDNFKFLENPLHIFISELSFMKDFIEDPKWIQERLIVKYSKFDIADAIARLIRMGIFTRNENSRLIRVQNHIYSKSDSHDQAAKNYHYQLMDIAKNSLANQNILKREFQSSAFNISLSKLQDIRNELRETFREIIAKYESAEEEDTELYQLNMQFFALSEK